MNKTLEWVKKHELPTGGIEAWEHFGNAYPEVTGYLIPTLVNYKELELCKRLSSWLCNTQNGDGSWCGLDGLHHTFDTAAIIEGLTALPEKTSAINKALERAMDFMKLNRLSPGILKRYPGSNDTALYTARASAIIGDNMDYWSILWNVWWGENQRTHYIAYLLEGLWNAGKQEMVRKALAVAVKGIVSNGLMAFYVNNDWTYRGQVDDICATIQFAILYYKAGNKLQANKLIKAVEPTIQSDGGVWQSTSDKRCISWAAKFYLDYLYVSQ